MTRRKHAAETGSRQIDNRRRRKNISENLQPEGKQFDRKPRAAKKKRRKEKREKDVEMVDFKNMRRQPERKPA